MNAVITPAESRDPQTDSKRRSDLQAKVIDIVSAPIAADHTDISTSRECWINFRAPFERRKSSPDSNVLLFQSLSTFSNATSTDTSTPPSS